MGLGRAAAVTRQTGKVDVARSQRDSAYCYNQPVEKPFAQCGCSIFKHRLAPAGDVLENRQYVLSIYK